MPNHETRTILVDESHAEVFTRTIGGTPQDIVCSVPDDAPTQASDTVSRSAGAARSSYGRLIDDVRDFTAAQPLGALLAAMSLGVIVSVLTARR